MWLGFLAFVKSQLGQKILLVLGCAVAAFIFFNWYGNNQYEKGRAVERKATTEDIRKGVEKEFKAREAALAQDRKAIEADKVRDIKARAETDKMKIELDKKLAAIQAASHAQAEVIHEVVNSIPGDELDEYIRRQSAKLGPPADQQSPAPQ
jgi:hypothetical protein